MHRAILVSLLALCAAALHTAAARGRDKVIYTGEYEGKAYTVRSHTTHTWNGNRTDWRLKLRGLPEVPIIIRIQKGTPVLPKGAYTTDWGPPYSNEVFGSRPYTYFTTPQYSNTPDDYSDDGTEQQHDYTVLYFSPGRFTRAEYDAYARFMKAEWRKVDSALGSTVRNFPHIIGTVYADREAIIHRFRGTYRGSPHVLRIDPDGYVNMGPDDPSEAGNHMRHAPVQMPGKVIRAHTIYPYGYDGLKAADIAGFRNAEGRSVRDFFRVED